MTIPVNAGSAGENPNGSMRCALVTGAGAGMGRATALALCADGYNVFAGDLNGEAATATASEAQASSGTISTAELDIRDRDSVRGFVEQALAEFGTFDVAFNCAGIRGEGAALIDTSDTDLNAVIDVNLLGTWNSMAEELRALERLGTGGLIVNAASATALRAAPGLAAYAMCKAAVVHATRTAAREYASKGIRVIALCPGPVDTAMMAPLSQAQRQHIIDAVPLGRMGEPAEIARVVVWLASDEASYMTGAAIAVDGGDSL